MNLGRCGAGCAAAGDGHRRRPCGHHCHSPSCEPPVRACNSPAQAPSGGLTICNESNPPKVADASSVPLCRGLNIGHEPPDRRPPVVPRWHDPLRVAPNLGQPATAQQSPCSHRNRRQGLELLGQLAGRPRTRGQDCWIRPAVDKCASIWSTSSGAAATIGDRCTPLPRPRAAKVPLTMEHPGWANTPR